MLTCITPLKRIYVLCIVCVGYFVSYTFSNVVSWEQYMEYYELFLPQALSWVTNKWGYLLHQRRCLSYDRGEQLLVSPACLMWNQWVFLDFPQAVDSILPVITHIDNIYETEQKTFTYQTATLLLDEQIVKDAHLFEHIPEWVLHALAQKDILIRVPKYVLWLQQMHNRSVYASVRDTHSYGRCRKNNYDIALNQMDKVLLLPEKKFNMNQQIAHLPHYCGWEGYMFSEWACGSSTQLFRNALVNPYLYVTKRYNHNDRYAWFYGSNVLGDDAAMYEMSKQFELQNIADVPVYFVTFQLADGNTALLSFVPKTEALLVTIDKKQTGPLTSLLTKSVTDLRTNSVAYQQEWHSRYFWINEEIDIPYRTLKTPSK